MFRFAAERVVDVGIQRGARTTIYLGMYMYRDNGSLTSVLTGAPMQNATRLNVLFLQNPTNQRVLNW